MRIENEGWRTVMLKHIVKFIFFLLLVCVMNLISLSAYALQTTTADSHKIHKVMLVIAMGTEAKPIITSLNLHRISHSFSNLPMQGYVGKYKKLDVLLIVNGIDPINKVQNVGTQAATLTTYLGIEYFHPDLIINIGTAGGVKKNGAKLGAVYASKKIYFYDRRIPSKGYYEYGLGGYQSFILSSIGKRVGVKSGIICSGDSFDDNQTDYNMFIKLNCTAVDMEAAGVAWLSMLTKTPMFAMKGVTNFVRGNDIHEQYRNNLPLVTLELTKQLKKVLNDISS